MNSDQAADANLRDARWQQKLNNAEHDVEVYKTNWQLALAARGCPCLYTTPCQPNCTCVMPFSSRGCERCCSYGSLEQRQAKAQALAAAYDERQRL